MPWLDLYHLEKNSAHPLMLSFIKLICSFQNFNTIETGFSYYFFGESLVIENDSRKSMKTDSTTTIFTIVARNITST